MSGNLRTLLLVLSVLSIPAAAAADTGHFNVRIAAQKTLHMTFRDGIFTPVADDAVLNVEELEKALAAGDATVSTGNGAAGDERGNLYVKAGLTWVSAHALRLDAYHSIAVDQPIVNAGTGALALATNDGGTGGIYRYGPNGNIAIWNTSNTLAIDGVPYVLVSDVRSLTKEIRKSPAGHYALASSSNANRDVVYRHSPIGVAFEGTFDGLGNTIANLSIVGGGLFAEVDTPATVRNVRLFNLTVDALHAPGWIGGLANVSKGLLSDDTISGTVTASGRSTAGGLVGDSTGTVLRCSSSASVTGGDAAGGLLGENEGLLSRSSASGVVTLTNHNHEGIGGGLVAIGFSGVIERSFAQGAVSAQGNAVAGGLVGALTTDGSTKIANTYATGAVTAGQNSIVGALIGETYQGGRKIAGASYAAGPVFDGAGSVTGGIVGSDQVPDGCGCFDDALWDRTTTGIWNRTEGSGNIANEPGLKGQTNVQLLSGLPPGFNPAIWKQNPAINKGLPYLIANPPR